MDKREPLGMGNKAKFKRKGFVLIRKYYSNARKWSIEFY